MKVAVVGPGAIGCLLAARMKQAGVPVVLVDHRPDRASRLSDQGIILKDKDGQHTEIVPIVSNFPEDASLAVVAVKSHCTKDLSIKGAAPILSVQNGIGNIETLSDEYGSERILCGVTSEAATLESEGYVRRSRYK